MHTTEKHRCIFMLIIKYDEILFDHLILGSVTTDKGYRFWSQLSNISIMDDLICLMSLLDVFSSI